MQGRLDRHCLLLNSYKHLSDPPIALGTPTLRPSASNRSRSAGSLTNFKIRFRSEATATTFYFKFEVFLKKEYFTVFKCGSLRNMQLLNNFDRCSVYFGE